MHSESFPQFSVRNEYEPINPPGKEPLFKAEIPGGLFPKDEDIFIVIGKHKYYDLLHVQLMTCAKTRDGKLKAPIVQVDPMTHVWRDKESRNLKFFLAVIRFQSFYEKSFYDLDGLKALLDNPFGYKFYRHNHTISEKVSPRSLVPVKIKISPLDVNVVLTRHESHYTVQCEFAVDGTRYPLEHVSIQFGYFITIHEQWYLCENVNTLKVLTYFADHGPVITLSLGAFAKFKEDVLRVIELYIPLEYINHETPPAVNASNFKQPYTAERIIYLSSLQNYVTINPVIRYGNTEIPVLSRKMIYENDAMGHPYRIERDQHLEDNFIALLLKQSTEFEEQLSNPLLYFYVHRTQFLDQHWFVRMFEDWRNHNIQVLGFSELPGNKFNSNPGSFSIRISSEVNWFKADIHVMFGGTRATLKQIQQSLKNKSHYILLDDGTVGIIPEKWIERFKNYFRTSEINDIYSLRTSKVNYAAISSLYGEAQIEQTAKIEIESYRQRFENIQDIAPVAIPATLQAQLRSYQHAGLTWLNLLDDLMFGGCLADDMGLGKSIQIIAFILLLNEKRKKQTHLLVVPTTLIHSWKQEFARFAPSLRIHVQHGASRVNVNTFGRYDVIITSYGTLVQDILKFTKFTFSYIFLDESQYIKNISSQRYKAACLLRSGNRITISGTPFENNVFDLYAQFSFTSPGLLGSKQYFRDTFAIPIGKFKSRYAVAALQERIKPFILRRTKAQVAKDLPEKTEVVLYCDMNEQQAALYAHEESKFREYILASKDDEIRKQAMHVLRGLTRLRQICNTPALLKDQAIAQQGTPKIDILVERIAAVIKDHKVLVFSQFVSMLEIVSERLQHEGIPYISLTGKTTKREQVVSKFQQDETIRVFLISLKAGGTGLNLTAADYVFIIDPWWNPATENQAIDRVHRIGQTKKIIATRLICRNSIEERMMELQAMKATISNSVVDAGTSFFDLISRDDLIALTSSQ
jgi:SNF2 family DNA or RNA helicase